MTRSLSFFLYAFWMGAFGLMAPPLSAQTVPGVAPADPVSPGLPVPDPAPATPAPATPAPATPAPQPAQTATASPAEPEAAPLSGAALVRSTTAQYLGDRAASRSELRRSETSRPVRVGDKIHLCANVDAFNGNGRYIGVTYLAIVLNEDGSEVEEVSDVTGLYHTCYGAKYGKFQELRSYTR